MTLLPQRAEAQLAHLFFPTCPLLKLGTVEQAVLGQGLL